MAVTQPLATPAAQVRPYVLLSQGARSLLLPQADVRTLEPVLDVVGDAPPRFGVGWIRFEDQLAPVYCLNKDLNPLRSLPASRRVCVLLNGPEGCFALACDRVQPLRDVQLQLRSIPPAMVRKGMLVRALVAYEDGIGLVTSAGALAAYLRVGS